MATGNVTLGSQSTPGQLVHKFKLEDLATDSKITLGSKSIVITASLIAKGTAAVASAIAAALTGTDGWTVTAKASEDSITITLKETVPQS